MNQPETYLWQSAYVSAVLETDDARMPTRIYEAFAAIEQRLLIPIEAGDVEQKEIEEAQRGLMRLKAERCGKRADSHGDARDNQASLGVSQL